LIIRVLPEVADSILLSDIRKMDEGVQVVDIVLIRK